MDEVLRKSKAKPEVYPQQKASDSNEPPTMSLTERVIALVDLHLRREEEAWKERKAG